MKNKKNVIIVSMLVLVAVMAIGYSYFATRLNINATGNITTNWNVYFSNITNGTVVGTASNNKTPSVTATTATMDVNLQLPGDSMTYELTLTNGGTIPAIIEDIKAEAKGSSAIIYSISGLKIGDKLASGASKTITIKIEYDPNTTSQPALTNKTLTVTIDAVQDIGQTIESEDIEIKGDYGAFARAIINNNDVYADNVASPYVLNSTGIDHNKSIIAVTSYSEYHDTEPYQEMWADNFLYGTSYEFDSSTGNYTLAGDIKQISFADLANEYSKYKYTCQSFSLDKGCSYGYLSVVLEVKSGYFVQMQQYASIPNYSYVNGNGLYSTSTNTEDNKTTYYFRGAVENNYVSFANQTWRIVRINEDGSIRLITDTSVGESVYNSASDDNAYAGYMYGSTGASSYALTHENKNNSEIKKFLDDWYMSNLNSYSAYLADAGFCNDRSTFEGSGVGYDETLYASYNRQNAPQFKCPNPENDLFTLTTSSRGNKKLTNPIGLITVDEVLYAGAYSLYDDNYFYLDNKGNGSWWTMTPAKSAIHIVEDFLVFNVWSVMETVGGAENGIVYDDSYNSGDFAVDNSFGVRPVINLKSNVEFTLEGTGIPGSSTNPYIIKTN